MVFCIIGAFLYAQEDTNKLDTPKDSIYYQTIKEKYTPLIVDKAYENQINWVDSIYDQMTLKEKVGQLFYG